MIIGQKNMRAALLTAALVATVFGATGAGPAVAEGAKAQTPTVGPVTGLKMPRFVSIKGKEANARRGPGLDHRIDWVFVRENLPVRVVAEFEHWRRVEDMDGAGGWMHYALLSGNRTAIVSPGVLVMRYSPKTTDHAKAKLPPGVVAMIEECDGLWCKISVGEKVGWVLQSGLWGTDADEVID